MNDSAPIRVLHLIDGLAGGGCERWLWDIVRLSDAEQFAHRIVTMQPDSGDFVYADRLHARKAYQSPRSPRFLSFLWSNIQDLAVRERLVPVRKFMTLTWRLGGYGLASRELLKAFIGFRPDVVHTHGIYGFVAGLTVKAVFSKPTIHTVPSLFEQIADARYGWTPALYARAQSWIDYFFTGASRAQLLGLGIPAEKIIFNRCGVDIQAITVAKNARDRHGAEVRDTLGLPQDAYIALSVGRFHPSKGHLFALESLAALLPQFPNLHWVVLGEGLQRSRLEAKAIELGVTSNVHLIGFHPDPLPYYAAANLYLRTPVFEAENLSSYQAMSMGLPVVGFDTGCETELVNKVGHGILVPNRDGEALAQAIAQILMLPDMGRAMGERGAEYGRNHLDISQMVASFFAAYQGLANGKAIKPPDSN